jgi:hypothetical protein
MKSALRKTSANTKTKKNVGFNDLSEQVSITKLKQITNSNDDEFYNEPRLHIKVETTTGERRNKLKGSRGFISLASSNRKFSIDGEEKKIGKSLITLSQDKTADLEKLERIKSSLYRKKDKLENENDNLQDEKFKIKKKLNFFKDFLKRKPNEDYIEYYKNEHKIDKKISAIEEIKKKIRENEDILININIDLRNIDNEIRELNGNPRSMFSMFRFSSARGIRKSKKLGKLRKTKKNKN